MKLLSTKIIAIAGAVVLIPVLALGWYLLSPLFQNKTVEEEFPFAFTASVPDGMTMDDVEKVMSTMSKMDAPADSESMDAMAEAVALKSGEFKDADRFHKGSGIGTLYDLPDGSSLLRLEDFRVTNGPDLHVLLVPHPNPEGGSDIHEGDYIDLGKIKGNIGNQELPAACRGRSFRVQLGGDLLQAVPRCVQCGVAQLRRYRR